ncbi:BTB/POZ domain-containing protein At1g03010-like isoform X1 [Hordeum vulgare subsp. vulgare]|uniref:BTB/POZ domain-containing protein At1g03010-like isoform X1 n=1 Tax=Hordeum vulgare subsp. vulgare TaxID=112509 RepID=UPI000B47105B|nr:BTB/POZ domain-containing protein At1g03010-like isoform X1 [Hordeum vulgare subsp. vulgare]
MGVATVTETKQSVSVSGKKMFRASLNNRHANEWPPTDVSSDLTVEVGTSSFALHKLLAQFPLVSRSGKIRRLVAEAKDAKLARLTLHATPGGAPAFELAAKFCYGVHVDITVANVAMLRCAARYLQMTDDFSDKNLELRTEAFLRDAVLPSIASSVAVLRTCEALLPAAEDVNLVARLIAAIANNVCKEQLASGLLSRLEQSAQLKPAAGIVELDSPGDWWGKSVAGLGLDLFQRLLSAVKSKGLRQETVTRILINYAQNSLYGLMAAEKCDGVMDTDAVKKQRAVVETIVGLLPAQSKKSPVPMAFLSGLLKTAMALSASSICKTDLEKRMGMQLDQAILEDILIATRSGEASTAGTGTVAAVQHHTLYDTDVVARIFSVFLNLDEDNEEEDGGCGGFDYDSPRSPKQSSIVKASKLLDSYLAEIALDSNLVPPKFISLAEILPDHARLVTDGIYRAVDIFLKVHPNIKEAERYRMCKAIDCQRLTPDACSHAAQNERLPVQMAVQVLYFEQIRLRSAIQSGGGGGGGVFGHDGAIFFGGTVSAATAQGSCSNMRSGSGVGSGAMSPRDNYASVRRENRELKLEVSRMRMRLTDLEKDHVSMKRELVRVNPANRLLRSFARSFGRLNTLFRMRPAAEPGLQQLGAKATADAKVLFQRRRRHSIS